MKKIMFVFLLMQQVYMHSQLDPLQKYPIGQVPTFLLSCIKPPSLPNVGSFGVIDITAAPFDLQIAKRFKISHTDRLRNFYSGPEHLFSNLVDKNQVIELESLARIDAPGKIIVTLDNASNVINIIICTVFPEQKTLSLAQSLQLNLSSLFDRSANFLKNLKQENMTPDEQMQDPGEQYFRTVIQKIKDTSNIKNFHVSQWTMDFSLDASWIITIKKLTLWFRYPVQNIPTIEEVQQGIFKEPCELKTFKYILTGQQLSDEGILQQLNEQDQNACKAPANSTQPTSGDTTTTQTTS